MRTSKLLKRFITVLYCLSFISILAPKVFASVDSVDEDLHIQKLKAQSYANICYNKMLLEFTDPSGEIDYPDEYGGCYINEDDILNICLVAPNDSLKQQYREYCGDQDIAFSEVTYSYNELCQIKTTVQNHQLRSTNRIIGVGICQEDNCVTICTEPSDNSVSTLSTLSLEKQIGKTMNVDNEAIKVTVVSNSGDTAVLKGGTSLYNGTANTRLSAGYWATKRVNGSTKSFLITVGHAVSSGDEIEVFSNGSYIGTASTNYISYEDVDAAIIELSSSSSLTKTAILSDGTVIKANYSYSMLAENTEVAMAFNGNTYEGEIYDNSYSYYSTCSATGERTEKTDTYRVEYYNADAVLNSTSGVSGSPVYYYNNGQWCVLGIQSYQESGIYGSATKLTNIVQEFSPLTIYK